MKKWRLLPQNPGKSKHIEEELGIPALVSDVLVARGIDTPSKVKDYISVDVPFTDPMSYKDMDKAVERINEALDEGQRICVYGDYDCDGMTATFLLFDYLSSVGCDVWYYIPDREVEGYGLNKDAIDFISSRETDLIITVDNGVTAVNEIDYASFLGIDVVVTDHHKPREILPDAVAVVDPHREDSEGEYRDLAGVGVAFKLVCALENDSGWEIMDQYADIICIGTIADIVPLTGENRIIVRHGLSIMPETTNLGLAALLEKTGFSGKRMTAESVAFGIAPKLNSAARLSSAYTVTELLTTSDPERASELADVLCEHNRRRQEMENEIVSDIEKLFVEKAPVLDDRVIVIDGRDWHHGVIGIVSSKVVERTGKPCVVVSSDGETARGSARSIEGFSMIDAVSYASDSLVRFGGHPFAAGMTMEADRIDEFRALINEYARKNFMAMPVYTINIDRVLDPADLTPENIRSLELLEPFGASNEVPVFAFRKVTVDGLYDVGGGKHLRIKFKKAGMTFFAVYFGMTEEEFPYSVGDVVDVAATCDISEYGGEERVSVKVRDVRPSSLSQEKLFSGNLIYDSYRRGEMIPSDEIPERDDCAAVYRYIKSAGTFRGDTDVLFGRVTGTDPGLSMDSCRMRLALDVLEEMGLISMSYDGRNETISIVPGAPKADLGSSQLLQRLRRGNA